MGSSIRDYVPSSKDAPVTDPGQEASAIALLKGLLAQAGGGGGGSKMQFLSGATDPGAEIGVPGDLYLNTASGDLFRSDSEGWALLLNLVGARGESGLQGPKGDTGEQGPAGPKGDTGGQGPPGFGTEAQYNDIVARLQALEAQVNGGA